MIINSATLSRWITMMEIDLDDKINSDSVIDQEKRSVYEEILTFLESAKTMKEVEEQKNAG